MTAPAPAPVLPADDAPIAGPAVVFHTMGTAVSFRAPSSVRDALTADVRRIFEEHDDRFSLYKPDSELSRVATGDLMLSRSSPALREMYALAVQWRISTEGLFDPIDPEGRLDLNGVVKAHAIEEAGEYLGRQGATDWSLNCGGDILCAGTQEPGTPWAIGISDPTARAATITTVATAPGRMAVATSGSSERGHHIWSRAQDRTQIRAPLQVSVVGADILTADVLATAICGSSPDTVPDLARRFGVDVLTVQPDGTAAWCRG